jgi:HlyD family secretion protein
MKRVVIVVAVLALLLTAAIAWKIHAQNEAAGGPPRGSGVVEGDGVDLSTRISARVTRVLVEEGATVESGAVLLELDCAEPEARRLEARARLEAARAQAVAARSQAQAAERQSQAARASIGAASAQINALDTQRSVAEREAERVESMGEHAALSRRDQARSAATGLDQQARAARATRTVNARQAAAALAQADAVSSQADAADRSVAALEALVQAAEIAVAECRIVAPLGGVVERIYYDAGELVMPGSIVARVIDASEMTATFYLSNADIDRATVGMRATVTADAMEEETFDATVHRIGLEAEFTPRNIQTRSDRDRLVFPVEVTIPNPDRKLRPGMPVTVTLVESER